VGEEQFLLHVTHLELVSKHDHVGNIFGDIRTDFDSDIVVVLIFSWTKILKLTGASWETFLSLELGIRIGFLQRGFLVRDALWLWRGVVDEDMVRDMLGCSKDQKNLYYR
jgi:hypothetical protein